MPQIKASPYSNQFSPIWSVTKAGAFIDAVDQAAISRREITVRERKAKAAGRAPHPEVRRQPLPLGLTPQRLAAAFAVLLISGLTLAGWIA